MKVVVFLLASLLTVCVVWTLDCTNLPDGHYNIGCRSYLECSGGKSTQVYCDKGEYYNINTKKCDGSGNVPEPCGVKKDCSNKPDGRYPDLRRDCHFYYVCIGHKFMLHQPCPAERYRIRQELEEGRRVQRPIHCDYNNQDNVTSSNESVYNNVVLEYCTRCKHKPEAITRDGKGLVLNEAIGICDWKRNVLPPCGTRSV